MSHLNSNSLRILTWNTVIKIDVFWSAEPILENDLGRKLRQRKLLAVKGLVSLKLKVWNIGIEGVQYVPVFNLKMPSEMHVIVKEVLDITYLLWQLFFMCYTSSVFNVFNLLQLHYLMWQS